MYSTLNFGGTFSPKLPKTRMTLDSLTYKEYLKRNTRLRRIKSPDVNEFNHQ